jgi:two-component system, NarL family, invasion response regulator UvrY
MIHVLIVDDHAIVRQGLKQIIESDPGMRVAAEASHGAEALRILRDADCDVVLLDLSMPDMNGMDVLKQIRAFNPMLPVLILSIHPEDQYAIRLIRAGAAGYLTKDSAPPEVIDALKRVADGRKYISETVAEIMADDLRAPEDKLPHERLSDREYQIFTLLASARTVTEIGEELSLSVKTVSTYRTRILEKMHLTNNMELMRYAVDKHLIK